MKGSPFRDRTQHRRQRSPEPEPTSQSRARLPIGISTACVSPTSYVSHVTALLIAETPDPPYTAVIFRSIRSDDTDGYGDMAARMGELAAEQPGYLGIETSVDATTGMTVSYWATDDDARAWKQIGEHLVAQRLGADRWYRDYVVRVATVERDYRHPAVGQATTTANTKANTKGRS